MQNDQFRSLKMQVQRRLSACLQLAETHFQRQFPKPAVSYDVRGLKAGVAYLQQNLIKLNRTLLLENPNEFIHQVVPHELAHLLVYQLFGRVKPHGKEWQGLMQNLFHLPADTCHQFDVQSVQGKTYAYDCGCQIHQLSQRRHHKMMRESAVYFCKFCGGKLEFCD
ncbi:SprT family zinc-dependent metalloprotease [Lonepinella koalarum]|uniref:Protein SprT n=1 Tax=Lonepinella koalarum TaxID=53417 RepID=A0A4R1KYK1_9PAST|nr:SprT family zinc-dependent metalloprotease [Lonepinella koalarum]MDH2926421.1 SprT family protein [Lonepinella koalarum]TCK69643.1 SprT protein [Lonepinella koalarum]TFJ89885.1 SprT family zinc-dependent metalloprotease [Lonepinella koalarum]